MQKTYAHAESLSPKQLTKHGKCSEFEKKEEKT